MNELANITAVILAGGLGTRPRSVVSDRPKVLADVCGRPFLEYLLTQLARDAQSVVLCVGYMAEQVSRRFGTRHQGMTRQLFPGAIPLGNRRCASTGIAADSFRRCVGTQR
jgi:NDP-sugar pyrophosphorylase family protein